MEMLRGETATFFWPIVLAVVLFASLLVPYLVKEIRKGKAQRRPGTPDGAGDVRPGTPSNPAPGQPDAQADPYSARAQRGAPPIRS